MDSDFHYYGSGTAALMAGFNKKDATLLANVAQYVDWFDSDYWSYWYIVDKQGKYIRDRNNNKFLYNYPQLSVQKIDWKMSFDYNPNIWNPFHFPPGNLPYNLNSNGWKDSFNKLHMLRNTNLSKIDANKLCRPYSKFAYDMIIDTVKKFKELSEAEGDNLTKLIDKYVSPRKRCPVTDGKTLALYLLGLRTHVLSDTWAHQDFTGEPNANINAAGTQNDVYAKDKNGNYKLATWTGTVWVIGDDTDCAAAPIVGGDKVCAGHGQMGHYPDYSWLQFKYPASWLPSGVRYQERNNPEEYDQAWSWVSFMMGLCNGSKSDFDMPQNTPDEIKDVMSTWHKLSTTGLKAVPESESLWQKTNLGKNLPKRWNPAKRSDLGLKGDLALTRYGSIYVEKDSTLHFMETVASMHYQFCIDWLKNNNDYSWKPWNPRT